MSSTRACQEALLPSFSMQHKPRRGYHRKAVAATQGGKVATTAAQLVAGLAGLLFCFFYLVNLDHVAGGVSQKDLVPSFNRPDAPIIEGDVVLR